MLLAVERFEGSPAGRRLAMAPKNSERPDAVGTGENNISGLKS